MPHRARHEHSKQDHHAAPDRLLALGFAVRAAEASPTPRAVVVRPGESIQAAIDRAPAYGTVVVSNGTYAENLLVTKPVTVVGDDVTLVPPETPRPNACLTSPEDRLPGFCILGDITIPGPETTPIINGYLDDVRIVGLRVTGFPGNGVFAYATDHLVVTGTELDHNGKDGAISLAGHRTTYSGNRVHDNGVFGLTIEDAPDARATITFNQVHREQRRRRPGSRQRSSHGHRELRRANCAGILALSTYAPATGMTITSEPGDSEQPLLPDERGRLPRRSRESASDSKVRRMRRSSATSRPGTCPTTAPTSRAATS